MIRFGRSNRIKKDPNRKVIRKLDIGNIRKNSNVEKEQIITKIKKHEKLYTFYLVIFFLIILIIALLLVSYPLKKYFGINSYISGELLVEYSPNEYGIGDVVTLTDADVLEDARVKDNENYSFSVTNQSNKKVKYQVILKEDKELIELDNCINKKFNANTIKFNINNGSVIYLSSKKVDDYYLLSEDVIPANSTKVYNINFWIDKNTNLEDYHFHGLLEVNMID